MSIAINSASLGKTVAIKGLVELGFCRVGALTWIVVVSLMGWLREMESSSSMAESEYSDREVEEPKHIIPCPASRSSLGECQIFLRNRV